MEDRNVWLWVRTLLTTEHFINTSITNIYIEKSTLSHEYILRISSMGKW